MNIQLIPLLDFPYEFRMKTREWRNSAQVSPYFKIKHINQETHARWLEHLDQQIPRTIAYVICYNDRHVGLTYMHSISRENGYADWGIYIHDPACRGKGVGKFTLQVCKEIARKQLGLHTLYLDVLKTNHAAVRLYESCNFVYQEDEEDGFARYMCKL